MNALQPLWNTVEKQQLTHMKLSEKETYWYNAIFIVTIKTHSSSFPIYIAIQI